MTNHRTRPIEGSSSHHTTMELSGSSPSTPTTRKPRPRAETSAMVHSESTAAAPTIRPARTTESTSAIDHPQPSAVAPTIEIARPSDHSSATPYAQPMTEAPTSRGTRPKASSSASARAESMPEAPTTNEIHTPLANQRAHDLIGLRIAAEMFADLQQARIACVNRVERGGMDPAFFAASLETIQRTENALLANLCGEYRRVIPEPIRGWQAKTAGLGEPSIARLLGVLGHPRFAHPKHWEGTGKQRQLVDAAPFERSISQLWSYCGVGDPKRKRRRGMDVDEALACGSPRLRALMFVISEGCMKTRNSPYRKVYDDAREQYATRVHAEACVRCGPSGKPAQPGTPWSPGHQHAAALRKVAKEVLRDLWIAAGDKGHVVAANHGDCALSPAALGANEPSRSIQQAPANSPARSTDASQALAARADPQSTRSSQPAPAHEASRSKSPSQVPSAMDRALPILVPQTTPAMKATRPMRISRASSATDGALTIVKPQTTPATRSSQPMVEAQTPPAMDRNPDTTRATAETLPKPASRRQTTTATQPALDGAMNGAQASPSSPRRHTRTETQRSGAAEPESGANVATRPIASPHQTSAQIQKQRRNAALQKRLRAAMERNKDILELLNDA